MSENWDFMKPTLVIVVDEAEPRQRLERDLLRRYGADYAVLAETHPAAALRRLTEPRRDEVAVPIVIADLWQHVPGMHGLDFLAQTRALQGEAKRILLVDYSNPAGVDLVVEGAAFGLFDRVLAKQGFPAEEWLFTHHPSPITRLLTRCR